METLNEFDIDSLNELINMAMGAAAEKLYELSGNEVKMTVPNVRLATVKEYKEMLEAEQTELISVSEGFSGDFNGNAVLLFHFNKSRNLIKCLLPDLTNEDEFTDLEEEVLTEIGNILLNSCIASFANVLQREFNTDIPKFNKGSTDYIINIVTQYLCDDTQNFSDESELTIILAEVDFFIQSKEISGHMVLTVTLPVLRSLLDELYSTLGIEQQANAINY